MYDLCFSKRRILAVVNILLDNIGLGDERIDMQTSGYLELQKLTNMRIFFRLITYLNSW